MISFVRETFWYSLLVFVNVVMYGGTYDLMTA